MKILIIAGHGDGDSGAVGNGFKEADLTRDVAKLLYDKLKDKCACTLADTSKNYFQYIKKNGFPFSGYDYLIEIHFNAGGGKGVELFTTKDRTAGNVEKSIVKNISDLGFANRGCKQKSFNVIAAARKKGIKSMLLEVCFIDSSTDMALFATKKNEIINAVVKAFGLESEEIDMDELNALKKEIESLKPKIYHYGKDIPDWGRSALQKAMDKGIFKGASESDLNLSEDSLKTLVYLERAGVI